MKKIFLLIIVISFLSCKSHKVFYAYEDKNTYAVLEMSTKKSEVTYKAVSHRYPNKFIRISGLKSLIREDYIGISYFNDLAVIDYNLELTPCIDIDGGKALIYILEGDKITFKESKNIECLKNYKIEWFPQTMTKVDKINYSKFPEEIRETAIALDKGGTVEKIEKLLQKKSDSIKANK
ncbi:hypothetical protein [Olleya sp. HaHaR_3_96]|uniref:hypothetical protein n=1 Tax=Olleya sp. HaHaR_3_96 TaxID=2745560 RepID=UPI001C4FD64A|nr:hypothetical protein [Olleya sp. HaHaR_3_96]QXP58264.1 hypothetical protein H0I26_10045 [Olleya sp. HaHaR_3_96]